MPDASMFRRKNPHEVLLQLAVTKMQADYFLTAVTGGIQPNWTTRRACATMKPDRKQEQQLAAAYLQNPCVTITSP